MASAQDGRGYLVELLEENLSGAGRDIRIEGFEGALSSTARLSKMTIADADGIWLILEGAELNWSRSAPLRGRLEVNELTAKRLEIVRAPVAEDDGLPQAEASGFSLPDLPVSINIDQFRVDEIALGAPLLGEAVSISAEASAQLAQGSGTLSLLAARIDGGVGEFRVVGKFDKPSQELTLDLDLAEGAEGIIARLLDLPGEPSLALTVKGDGTLADFTSDIQLTSDGAERLAGTVTLREAVQVEGETVPTRVFAVDLGGDVTALFLPQYREFFGDDLRLQADGQRAPDGTLTLDSFALVAQSLRLGGAVTLDRDGWPLFIDVTGDVASQTGEAVLLPIGGGETKVSSAELAISYDQAEGDVWQAEVSVEGFEAAQLTLERVAMTGTGDLTAELGQVGRIGGKITIATSGMRFADESLAQAVGDQISGDLKLEYVDGTPLHLSDISLRGADYGVSGSAKIDALSEAFETEFDIALVAENLTRFSAIAGRALRGRAMLDLAGTAAPLAGSFDVNAKGKVTDLDVAQDMANRLLSGATQLDLSVRRDESGTLLRGFELVNPQVELSATARLATDDSEVQFTANLTESGDILDALEGPLTVEGAAIQDIRGWSVDVGAGGPFGATAAVSGLATGPDAALKFSADLPSVGVFVPQLPGPLQANGQVQKAGDDWNVQARATAPGNTQLTTAGLVRADGMLDLAINGASDLTLAGPFLAPRSVAGRANFDLQLRGPLGLGALSGRVTTQGARFVDAGLGFTLENLNLTADLSGGRAQLTTDALLSTGGQLSVSGPVTLSGRFPAELQIQLRRAVLVDSKLYKTVVDSDLTLSGPVAGGARISGRVDVGLTEIRVPTSGGSVAGGLPPIKHVGAPREVRQTLSRAGQLGPSESKQGGGPAFELDVQINAPSQIFVRGRGIDAELGGGLRITGTTKDVISTGQLNLIRGRLDLLTKRFRLDEGLVQMQGSLVPYLRFVARTQTDQGSASVVIAGPASQPVVSFGSVPELPEDEILAQIFFGRDLSQISAFQALQLANAVAVLAGKGGEGIVAKLRKGFGLDDFDVSTDQDGNSSVRAGKYISDNVYTDVTVGGATGGKVSLNIDLSNSLTARGSLAADGDTSVGVFFERDY